MRYPVSLLSRAMLGEEVLGPQQIQNTLNHHTQVFAHLFQVSPSSSGGSSAVTWWATAMLGIEGIRDNEHDNIGGLCGQGMKMEGCLCQWEYWEVK